MKKIIIAVIVMVATLMAVSGFALAGTKITFTTPQVQSSAVEGDMVSFTIKPDKIYSRILIKNTDSLVIKDGDRRCNFTPGDGYYAGIINSVVSAGAVGSKYIDKIEQGIFAKCKQKYNWSGTVESN